MYRTKECVDEFEYKFKDSETGKIKKFKITEKRIVTFNPKLAKKQIYEINKEVEKAKLLKASQAKRSEYGDSAKYVIFTTTDKKGNNTNGKIKVTMNEDLIKKSVELAGYNMLVTSEISMADKERVVLPQTQGTMRPVGAIFQKAYSYVFVHRKSDVDIFPDL